MIPVEADLTIVDWSGIVHGAWHEAGPEGMLKRVAGELLRLLEEPARDEGFAPARLVLATDAGLPTHRHELTAHLDAPKRYKANRERKPREFWPLVDRLEQLPLALRIPTLAPDGFAPQTWEADDSAATATHRARAAGLTVLLVSRDKDWRQLVTDEAPAVRWWSAMDQKLLDAAGVIGEHGVPPELLADWLALVGDSSDNVPGCEGIGPEKATALLKAWGGVAGILRASPLGPEELGATTKALANARRERDKAKKAFADASASEATAKYIAQDIARWKALAAVHAHRAEVELSRKLVELRTDVPIALDLDEALVGGWDVREVRRVLESLGCGWLGRGIEARPKRAPRKGRTAEDVRPPRAREARSDDRDRNRELRQAGADAGAGGDGGSGRGGSGAPVLPPPREPAADGGGDPGGRRAPEVRGGVRGLPPGADGVRPDPPGAAADLTPIIAPSARPPEDEIVRQEEALARAMVERVTGPNKMGKLGLQYAIEDLEEPKGNKRVKYPRLRPEVRGELLAKLRAAGTVAA